MASAAEDVPTREVWIPPFWPKNVRLWFAVVEKQFQNMCITSDELKFNIIMASLQNDHHIKGVMGVFPNSPRTGRYEQLKNELIERLA